MEPIFVRTFWITVTMLWVALVLLYFILTNRRSLQRKGHKQEYIDYLRRSHLIRICIIAVVLPVLILCSAWIVSKLTGTLADEAQLGYIVVVLIVLVIPFKFIDDRINQKKIRELALETREKVTIDLNYKTLHLIFNPWIELFLGISSALYGVFYLHIEQWIVYLFLLFPWFMYLNIRGIRYQTRPYLMDNYKYLYAFNLFSYTFFLFFFIAYLINRGSELVDLFNSGFASGFNNSYLPSILLLLVGVLIALGNAGRIGLYLSNYKSFNHEINGTPDTSRSHFPRKLLFLAISVLIVLSLSGLGIMSGLTGNDRSEVGMVLEKYIIEEKGDSIMYCSIELCDNQKSKDYRVCCISTYEKLTPNVLVKFRCEGGNTITEVIE